MILGESEGRSGVKGKTGAKRRDETLRRTDGMSGGRLGRGGKKEKEEKKEEKRRDDAFLGEFG